MTFPASGNRKLILDEPSFQKLLAAAYALQQSKDVLEAGSSEHDSALVFSEIAALRSQILAHVNSAELKAVDPEDPQSTPNPAADAAALVADCLKRLTKADGASVCLIIDGYLRPTACSGTIAKVSGGSVASNSLVATERLRNGRSFQSANACSDIRLGPSLCVDLHIGSLLACPIQRQNEIAGVIEVRWTNADAFSGGDERICQLMAELMGEVLESEAGLVNTSPAHVVPVSAPTRAVAVAGVPADQSEAQAQEVSREPGVAVAQAASSQDICRVCGKPIIAGDSFCGSCGMMTATDNTLQGKWASMWFMQQAKQAVEPTEERPERRWPIHAVRTPDSSPRRGHNDNASSGENSSPHLGIEAAPEGKRSPRGVLAILKSRLKARA